MTNFSVIITAGGSSTRFGKSNKLLEKISDKTVIEETVLKFSDLNNITGIIIPANISIIAVLKGIFNNKKIMIIEGGETRQQSVYNALQYVNEDYVLIHDGARPLVSKDIIQNVMEKVVNYDAVSVMTKTTDTIKQVDENGKIIKTIDRTKLYNTQTPQAFKTSIIKDVHERLKNNNYTDDSSMLEEFNIPVYIEEGDYKNIKITTKSDLDFAKIYI